MVRPGRSTRAHTVSSPTGTRPRTSTVRAHDLGLASRLAALQRADQQRARRAHVLRPGEPGAGGGRRGVEALAVGAVEGEVERFGHGSIMPPQPARSADVCSAGAPGQPG